MKREPIDVFGLGQCCLDYVARVRSYPPPDAKCEFSEMAMQGGGPVATALVALSRWGLSCAFAGVAGDDSFGAMIRTSLDEEGVDTRGLVIRAGCGSQFAFIVAEPGVGRRTVFWRRPTGHALQPDEVDVARIREARAFHTDGLFIDASLAAAREAKRAGVAVVVDAGSLRPGMLDLARESDYFVASEKFARELAGEDGPAEACRRLAGLGPRVVGVTLGARGYVASFGGEFIERPAYAADAVDTTGCGDVFHAGLTYGVAREWPVEQSLDFAAWAAARVSTRLGGREGIPSKDADPES
ncbi:MAG: ribokinase [Candidatus Krumholzibacteriota bacterium]|nr:ribokinase [Candidatus Krumholzibacteriota bacterium]